MKKISYILLLLVFASFMLIGCDGMLKVDSDRDVFVDDYGLKSTNDSLYSIFGVLSQVEKLADSYVLLGELRGDLMDVTSKAGPYLKEINNFNISADNPYVNKKDYYAIINNCNYIIKNADTTLLKNNEKVMYKVLAAAKGIRAWTYMQLALNFKTVIYYEEPLLTLKDAEKSFPVYDLEQLADVLIKDIEPYKDYTKPSFGSLYTADISDCFFPIRFILGDLYLWTGQYENAANEYRDLIFKERYLITASYQSSLTVVNKVFNGGSELYWGSCFLTSSSENITNIIASNEYSDVFMLDSLVKDYQLTASPFILNDWDSSRYMNSATLDTLCDLRKRQSVMSNMEVGSTYFMGGASTLLTKNYLSKFIYMNLPSSVTKKVMPYRVALLYLRYAEAVNRLGKTHLAMAVLKNGLNPTIYNGVIIPVSEIPIPMPNYMNFTNSRFTYNIGIRARSLFHPELDDRFVIPATLDSIAKISYMEDLICNELALETAFEGNRFHDLMRIAIRRDSTDYLAAKVAAKHPNNSNILGILRDRNNWYLK